LISSSHQRAPFGYILSEHLLDRSFSGADFLQLQHLDNLFSRKLNYDWGSPTVPKAMVVLAVKYIKENGTNTIEFQA